MRLTSLGGLSLLEIAKRSISGYLDHDMNTHASALAYRALFSLFPFLIFLLTLLGAIGWDDFFSWLIEQAERGLPAEVINPINTVISQIREGATSSLLSFSLVTSIWAASTGVRAVINALNVAYDVKERRPIWLLYPMSLVYTLGLVFMLLILAGFMFIGPQAIAWIAEQVGIGDNLVTWWIRLRVPIAALLSMLAIGVIYYVLPNVNMPFQLLSPGAIFTVLAIQVATFGFNIYLANFANFNATYGSLGGLFILLFYMYICAAVLLFGAEVNATIFHAQSGAARGSPAATTQ